MFNHSHNYLLLRRALGADVIVKSNTGYRISASSFNNGRMKHIVKNTYVPYTFTFNNSIKNLSASQTNPVIIQTSAASSSINGDRYHASIKIGDLPQNLFAGKYTDYITLTVTSP